jgi:DNA mismatch repair protein MutS2
MMFPDIALKRLEYPRLVQLLAGQTQSEPGRMLAASLRPLTGEKAVENALDQLDEAIVLLEDGQAPSFGGGWNLLPILAAAQASDSLIAAPELLKILSSLRVFDCCQRWFKNQPQQSMLRHLAEQLEPLSELQKRLQDSIGSRGELLDSASFELGNIRYQGRQLRSRIKQQLDQLLTSERYSSCFQERLVTLRNGRYVLPLKSDCRGQLKGFVLDESASGQTLYLEPTQVFDNNNKLQQLQRDEQREERRILLQLADLVRRDRDVLEHNQQLLAVLDLRFACARLSRSYNGVRPHLVAGREIELKQARHPLLMEKNGHFDADSAVAVDILLPQDCHALVISGPNTGGKSVALKTLGLYLLMVRSGLRLPCHPDSRLHLFEQLHVDIGDEQSIEQSLSTFSGHLLRIRQILEQADSETLVLLDEAGSGTDPAEGAALVQALIDQLGRQGAKVLLTTHLGQLKHFADSQPGIENAAVEFDPVTLLPTYRLRYGLPGASSALATARRMGLPESLIEKAIAYLGHEDYDQSHLLARLNQRQQDLEQELELARQARVDAAAAQQLRKRQLQDLKSKKKEILRKALRKADELIIDTETKMKTLRKRASKTVAPAEAVDDRRLLSEARDTLKKYKPHARKAQGAAQDLRIGEIVSIVSLGIEAKVEKVANNKAHLLVGNKRMWQPLSALEQFNPRRYATKKARQGQLTRRIEERQQTTQLKLIGQRLDDALTSLQRFVDDARLSNLRSIEIIHGSGEGVLRRAVREQLAKEPNVTAFYAAPLDQGGENITIAELDGR